MLKEKQIIFSFLAQVLSLEKKESVVLIMWNLVVHYLQFIFGMTIVDNTPTILKENLNFYLLSLLYFEEEWMKQQRCPSPNFFRGGKVGVPSNNIRFIYSKHYLIHGDTIK